MAPDKQLVIEWVKAAAEKTGTHITLYEDQSRWEGLFLHLPVSVNEAEWDAVDKAWKLQEIEDSWNYQEPEPIVRLLLVPASASK